MYERIGLEPLLKCTFSYSHPCLVIWLLPLSCGVSGLVSACVGVFRLYLFFVLQMVFFQLVTLSRCSIIPNNPDCSPHMCTLHPSHPSHPTRHAWWQRQATALRHRGTSHSTLVVHALRRTRTLCRSAAMCTPMRRYACCIVRVTLCVW